MERDAVLNVFGKWTEKVLKWRWQEGRSKHERRYNDENDEHYTSRKKEEKNNKKKRLTSTDRFEGGRRYSE